MKIESYASALAYLNTFISPIIFKRIEDNTGFDPLERMRTLLGLLGNPEKKFRSILVTGTSGKGSTAYLISHILKTAGYKVGLTISPHLQKVNERFQINGEQISDQKFIRSLNSILSSIDGMKKMSVGAPSYFEILIALAFLYFSKEKVDIAVVEVGIEGKYDATNVLSPLMVVLTNISLDHTQILGDTVEKIAREAVGAIKSEKRKAKSEKQENKLIVVTGVKQKSVIKIVEEKCEEVRAKLLRLGKDFDFLRHSERSEESQILRLKPQDDMGGLKLSLLGDYQKENASLAVEAVRRLADFGFKVSEENIKQALSTAFFPGRFEVIQIARQPRVSDDARLQNFKTQSLNSASLSKIRHQAERKPNFSSSESGLPRSVSHFSPLISHLVLDGAHNPAKMRAFISSLQKIFPSERKIFLVAFKKDKNIKAMLEEILPVADTIIATKFSMATDVSVYASAPLDSIKHYVSSIKYKNNVKVFYEENSKKALNKALAIQQLNNKTIIVVTGSLYLVGEIRTAIFS